MLTSIDVKFSSAFACVSANSGDKGILGMGDILHNQLHNKTLSLVLFLVLFHVFQKQDLFPRYFLLSKK